MNNFSESNKKLISELVSDLEVKLIDNKNPCRSIVINEDIEKEIDDIIEVLLISEGDRAKKFGSGSSGRGGFGSGSAGRGRLGRGSSGRGGSAGRSFSRGTAGTNATPIYRATGGGNSSIASIATQEYNNYKDFTEDQPELKDRIQDKYWPAAGESSNRGTGDGDPWSAAFISFAALGTGLQSSTGHKTYMQQAYDNRDSADGDVDKLNDISRSKYVAFLPGEKRPSNGDIVCKPRGSGNGWDNIGPKNHCDIFVGDGAIGGNLSHSVGKNPYRGYTMIISKGASATSISNDAVASNDSDNDSDSSSDT